MAVILVVEDEELISTMVRLNLEREGYGVKHFGDAESALVFARAEPSGFDMVLMDIMLPGMHGDEAVAELRKLGADVPIIMLTAKKDMDTRVNALNQGADDYLAKPFNVEELLARVNAQLRRYKSQ